MFKDLVLKNRSCRRFVQEVPVELETLRQLVELARNSASLANRQPLKYVLCCDAELNAQVFPHLGWAGYLTDWAGPVQGERPAAYIVVLADREINPAPVCDQGIAVQSILLGATERGLGGCIVGSHQREGVREVLAVPEKYEILLVIALGKPAETVIIEDVGPDGDIRYYRDADDGHHVPKRTLDELIVGERG